MTTRSFYDSVDAAASELTPSQTRSSLGQVDTAKVGSSRERQAHVEANREHSAEIAPDGTPADPRLGTIVGGRYTLTSILGIGGMATVYGSRNREGRPFAVKVLHADYRGMSSVEQGMIREATVMRSLRCDGVLRVHDEGRTREQDLFFVMDQLDGLNAVDFLAHRGGRLSLQEALLTGTQLLEILTTVHEAGYVHRDIKPANVFLMRDGVVRLLDFGVTLLPDDDRTESDGSRLGTPAYMAPEQAMNATLGVDARSDLFSVGATLYLLLSGQRIRDAATPEETFVMAATTAPPSLARGAPDLPVGVIKVIDRAMAWNPADRFASAAEMRDALLPYLEQGEGDAETQARIRRESLRSILVKALLEGEQVADEGFRNRRTMREYMRPFAALLVALYRHGWNSDDTRGKFETLAVETERIGRSIGTGVILTVRPHSFEYLGDCIWEPEPPLNEIPYILFLGGFRTIRILPDIPKEELTAFLNLLTIDPVRDLSPEDDLGSIFLETGFPHIDAELITSFDMTLLDEASSLDEQLAEVRASIDAQLDQEREALADAAVLSEDFGARSVIEARAIDVDLSGSGDNQAGRTRFDLRSLAEELGRYRGERSHDLARVLAYAVRDAYRHGDCEEMYEPIREYVDSSALARRLPELMSVFEALFRAVPSEQMPSFVAATVQHKAVRRLFDDAESPIEYQGRTWHAVHMPVFGELLSHVLPNHFGDSLSRLCDDAEGPLGQLIAALLTDHVVGNETAVGEALRTAKPAAATVLLHALQTHITPDALPAMRQAAHNPHELVRLGGIRARLAVRDPSVAEDYRDVLHARDPQVRLGALKVAREANQGALVPLIAQASQEDRFHDLPLAERQQTLSTLLRMQAQAGEDACIYLIRPHSLLPDDRTTSTRVLAAELLGSLAQSASALAALEAESKRFVRHNKVVRDALTRAADQLRPRLRRPSNA